MSEHSYPVFFDRTGKRKKKMVRLMTGLALVLSIVGAAVCFSVFAFPVTPLVVKDDTSAHRFIARFNHRLLPNLETREQAARKFIASKSQEKLSNQIEKEQVKKPAVHPRSPGAPYSTVVGFYVNWEATSYTSLLRHINSLTYIMPEWLYLNHNGRGFSSRWNKTTCDPLVEKIAHQHNVPIIPMLDNIDQGAFQWKTLKALLSDHRAQIKLARNLKKYLIAHQYGGINIDFEPPYPDIPNSEMPQAVKLIHDALPDFIKTLHKEFAPANLIVTQDLPAQDANFDYGTLSDINDFVVVMLYDQHFVGSNPGPIASQNWIEQKADFLFSQMDSEKVVLGLGNYCYDWPIKCDKNGYIIYDNDGEIAYAGNGKKLLLGPALLLAKESQAQIRMDDADRNPYFTYSDKNNTDHIVYILDAATIYNQIQALKDYRPRGAALWYLGSEDPSLWSFFDEHKLSKPVKKSALEKVVYRTDFNPDPEGQGELVEVIDKPAPGHRNITLDKDGLVDSESYTAYPSPYIVRRFGYHPHEVALTFDDGPDPTYTPQILNVLKKNHIPGTFFVIGEAADRYPDLIRTTWEEGNEIGNHTFTHPHIAAVSPLRADLEVNTTQRVIESIIGHSSILFRPPFGEGSDSNATSPEEMILQLRMQGLGYVSVGMNIDSKDYLNLGVNRIVTKVNDSIKSIENRTAEKGSVILFHDGGGNRDQTVAALPKVIKDLKARGYKFVTVSQLMDGEKWSSVFPAVPHREEAIAGFDRLAFESGFAASNGLRIIFFIAILLGILRIIITAPLALLQSRREHHMNDQHDFKPPVTVIIPAYNEGKVICRTIDTVLASDYPDLRVIVVDDGSTDDTADVVRREFSDESRLTFIRKENGGKSTALNLAIEETETEFIVCVDADTVLAKDAVSKLIRHFVDPRVGAVAGNVKVGNRINALTLWQSVEYITSQNFDRRAFSILNSISVVPGAIGAWRKTAILRAGGYESNTLAEDTDLTFRIRLLGYHTQTENGALAYTEAPDTAKTLAKQRFRWAFGTLQALWKHRRELFKRRNGAFGMLVMPAMWTYSILFQALAPIVDVLVVLSLINGDIVMVLSYTAALFVLDFASSLLAFKLDHEDTKQLAWLFWQRFFYRQLMYYVIIKSLFAALHGYGVGWGKLQRKATANLPTK